MEDVTDAAFRATIAKYSKQSKLSHLVTKFWRRGWKKMPVVFWTEFVSADGLVHAGEKGQRKLRAKLRFTRAERPIVAQLFTANPEYMERAARIVQELGFDGVDINMGCPERAVERQGAGAALIKTPALARELIRAAKRGSPKLPVSVKTRIGYNENEIATWIPELLAEKPAALTLHARTRKELSLVPARWEHVREVVALRDKLSPETVIIGNGDVQDLEDAREKAALSGADGVMIGRGVFGNPFLFSGKTPTHAEKLNALKWHTKRFEKELRGIKSFATMKKHFASYVGGFTGAKELRIQLMDAENAKEVCAIIDAHLKAHD